MSIKIKNIITLILFPSICTFSYSQNIDGVKKFTIHELISECKSRNIQWMQFLDEATVGAGFYLVREGQKNEQPASKYDKVYYLVSGQTDFIAHEKKISMYPGRIIYVKAGVTHQFVNIKKELQLLVLFSKALPDSTKDTTEAFDMTELVKVGNPKENDYNPFVNKNTMYFGLYQLPVSLGGDKALVHKWDEINVVTKGESKFSVASKGMEVKAGDIFYVSKGLEHYFHSLKSDLDVLILFEKKSIVNQ